MRSRPLTFSLVTEERVVIMNGCANRFDIQRRLGFERAAHVKSSMERCARGHALRTKFSERQRTLRSDGAMRCIVTRYI